MNRLISLVLLLGFIGCGTNEEIPIPPTSGDFVSNDNGAGTAQVFGIDFSVRVNSGGASTDDTIHANFIDPEESGARKSFTLGDEIRIQLESIDDTEVRFMFNDQDYGILNVGDKVVIDSDRNVEVNGTVRLPNASE